LPNSSIDYTISEKNLRGLSLEEMNDGSAIFIFSCQILIPENQLVELQVRKESNFNFTDEEPTIYLATVKKLEII